MNELDADLNRLFEAGVYIAQNSEGFDDGGIKYKAISLAQARQRIIAWVENEIIQPDELIGRNDPTGYQFNMEGRNALRADQRKKLSDTSKGGE